MILKREAMRLRIYERAQDIKKGMMPEYKT